MTEGNSQEVMSGASSGNDDDGDERTSMTNDHDKCCQNPSQPLLTEEKMRRRLQFFFMNPIEKWQAKRRFPYKFVIQLLKIGLVTAQLTLFAQSRYKHVDYTGDNKITFSHLFLKGWDATREINAYPPATGPLAIYKIDDFYDTIDYAYVGYSNIHEAIGSYSYTNEDNTMTDMVFCVSQYKNGSVFAYNESYVFDPEVIQSCINISQTPSDGMLDSRAYLNDLNINISFSALVTATLQFSLKTIDFKAAGRISGPNCYQFNIIITFNNEDQDGQMLLGLDAEPIRLMCKGDVHYITRNDWDTFLRSLLNYLVISICVASFVLCSRAVWRAQQLKNITNTFFINHFNKSLSLSDRRKFLNFWYIMIIVNDVLIIIGSAIKEQIERKEFTSDQWNVCSLFLGLGNMLVWFGVLRYLGFFKTYNVVILTLEKAAPTMFRFLICALLIYAGFIFCGWLILGPYHLKFRSLSTASECLFSLINGDDMFATFSIMSNKSNMLWWFSKIYLYTFISLYIYVILSLFISVIMDAYDTIKVYYREGFPKSDLQLFIGDATVEEVTSGIFRSASNESIGCLVQELCCCNCRRLHRSYSTLSGTSYKTEGPRPGGIPV